MSDSKLLLIDGHSLAFRSFYALRPDNFVTAGGQYTNAVSGFLSTLLKLIAQYAPTHIAVAFDLPGGTFRTRQYAEYKGGRAKTPVEFAGQIELIQQSLDAMGIRWMTYEDYEADDIVATLATLGQDEGMHVFVASGDKDSYQLVTENCTVLYPMPRQEMLVLDPEGIREKTGVLPSQYQDMAALVGEGADNLPGVPGVGPKTAAKWITTYGDLEGIISHADEIKGKVGQSFRDNIALARLNRDLNDLVRDLPLVENLDELVPSGVDREAVHALFDTLGFRNLRTRVLAELPMREGDSAATPEEAAAEIVVERGAFSAWLHANRASAYGVHLVDPQNWGTGGSGAVLAVGTRAGGAWIGEWDVIAAAERQAIIDFLGGETGKVFHGAKEAGHALDKLGARLTNVVGDTKLSAYLLHPDSRVYDLADLLVRYTPYTLDEENADTLFVELTTDAQATAAVAVIALEQALRAELREQGEDGNLIRMELAVSATLGDMERAGIAIDEPLLEALREEFNGRVEAAARSAYEAIDREVNLSSPKQLQDVLFDQLGLPPTKRTKSGYTTNADALADLAAQIAFREDPQALAGQQFLGSLLAHRDAIKLRQSVEGLQRAVRDGRIHTTYQQTVAATGRLSSTDPNLQNIHARTEEGMKIREAFVPGKGFEALMTADYSQIEMRLMAALSGDEQLIAAFNEGADLHTYVASRVYGIHEAEVTPAQRSHIKAMSYGLAYGLSSYGLSQQLHIAVPEAQRLMDDYFERFGRVRAYLEGLVDTARRDGYTQTILGRRRYLPDLNSTNRQARDAAERMALNAPIQGSAADIIKIAMVDVANSLADARLTSRVLLQVHDELVLEIAPGEREKVEEIVRRDMAGAANLGVPLSVGIGVGENWRLAAH